MGEQQSTMAGIGIITNPHSKLNKRDPDRQKLLGYIVGEHGKLELTSSLSDLARVAVNFRDHNISVLAINGGDGTIGRTITAFIRAYGEKPLPKVLILRGGTINLLADNLRIRGAPEQILVRYIESMSDIRPARTEAYRTLQIDDHYGFLFGNGLVAHFLEEFYKKKTGPLGSILTIARIYLWYIFARNRYTALIGEQAYHVTQNRGAIDLGTRRTVALMASTVERMPLGPRFFPLARRQGMFQFFSLEIPAAQLPWRLPFAFICNGEGHYFGKLSRLAPHLTVATTDRSPQKYTLDGELFSSQNGKLEISLGPEIEFVVV